ncbi:hypothetical protein K435DRAFT_771973 [Dendrothele bispora CBS 962.96]|uniref:DUF7704 domain-containing protein n=1 Tax=Dendrothele bispora (strain CBS 962.96) TaxID=1314807 RepID=A0A4V4HJ04_DENBC|nr:hypothetical protein K435DRAFT_771973 [Dendrothele bispora CBS 962.96]
MAPPTSAIPDRYYAIFAIYEPFLCAVGFLGAWADPKTTHDGQAPWPNDSPPLDELPRATLVTIIQLAHVCFLLGIINHFVLSAARRHLQNNVALQEKIVSSLLIPLLLGDILHLYVTIWALGDQKWNFREWTPMLWTTLGLGLTLMIPRICWHLGIGRYVDSRDGIHKGASGKTPS